MKKIYLLLILFNFSVIAQHTLTQEEKNEIINNLDSSSYFIRLDAIIKILKNGISEALPKLEEKIFEQEQDIASLFLEGIVAFDSINTVYYAHKLVDTLSFLPRHPTSTGSINSHKVFATLLLFTKGDYSTASVLFDYIEEMKPGVAPTAFYLLEDVLKHVPEYEAQAKAELKRIIQLPNDDYNTSIAIQVLSEKYGNEIIPDLLYVLENVTSNTSKNLAFEELEELNYSELENLTKSQFLQDSVRSWVMLNKLLTDYNTPANYKFILDNYKTSLSMDQVAKYNWLFQSDKAIPSKDYDLISDYLDFIYSLCDTLPVYTWLGDLQFKDDLQSILQSAKTNLLAGDSLSCAIDVKAFQNSVDNVYADSLNTDPPFVTLEGWKFLYWNAQYILDRLQKVEATKEDE